MRANLLRETRRLLLRPPLRADAQEIFERYASDPAVTRYLSWPTHATHDDTSAFIDFSNAEWSRWPAGPYLVFSRQTGALLGSTGLAFETTYRASTGYVFARDAWGKGYATEALRAMVELAREAGVHRLHAHAHLDHVASRRVLEKGEFVFEGVLRGHTVFPNLGPAPPDDVASYVRLLGRS
ncbi:MAG: GNAT family N-acetyltransferase [Vicinamibacterales bacterium]